MFTPNFKFFVPQPRTLADGKKLYRDLCMTNHPDHGGSEDAMKQINAEWDYLKSRLPRFDTGVHTDYAARRAAEEAEQAKADAVDAALRPMVDKLKRAGIRFDIVGKWIWSDDRRAAGAGMSWSKSRKKWYWRPEEAASSSRGSRQSYSEIYRKYGGFNGQNANTSRRETITA